MSLVKSYLRRVGSKKVRVRKHYRKDVTRNYIRHRIRDPKLFKKSSFRTLDIGRPKKHMLIRGKLKKTGKYVTQSVIVQRGTKLSKDIIRKARRY